MFDVKFLKDDIEMAFKYIMAKNPIYTQYWNFYDGDHPQTFLTKRLREIFKGIDVNFTENWCAVVVDSMLERINLNGFTVSGNKEATLLIEDVWSQMAFKFEADEIHEMTLVTGEGFLIVWPDKNNKLQMYANDSRHCHAFYYADNPRVMRYAAKLWQAGKRYYMTLYYPDRLEYLVSKDEIKTNMSKCEFIPLFYDDDKWINPAPNPYNKIPVFHFRTSRRKTKSELKSVVDPQSVINKSLNDMMASQEFESFAQKYIISNAKVGKLKIAPGEIWDLPAGDGEGQRTEVGQFDAASPEGYLKVMDRSANVIAATTRTPKHYFFGGSSNLSGEALIAMEAPLNKKCSDRIERFSYVWKHVVSFGLNLITGSDNIRPSDIKPMYEKPATIQPKTQSEIRKNSVGAGLPLPTVLRDEGRSEGEIESILEEREAEDMRRQRTLASAVMNAQADLNAGLQDNGQLIEDDL